jgi:pimeloyl-ACP methyl ester carboxylesterase
MLAVIFLLLKNRWWQSIQVRFNPDARANPINFNDLDSAHSEERDISSPGRADAKEEKAIMKPFESFPMSWNSCLFGAALAAAAGSACATPAASPRAESAAPSRSGFAPVNGIEMYYEIHGSDGKTPLVLLNGGGSTIDVAYGRILPYLARDRKVIALEEQGHGRTTDRNQPFRAETSADDVVALLDHLQVKQADVMGFSNGAGVAMQVAIRHPERIRKLVFASYMTKRKGAYPWLWEAMKTASFSNMPQPLKDAFLKVNPDPAKLRNMCEKDIERMRSFRDVGEKSVRSIRAPTLVLIGDRDVAPPEHAAEVSRMIPGARLMILPGAHGEYMGELLTAKPGSRAPELTARLIGEFLSVDPEGSQH